jgi:3-oxoacyl-[acyl-carrier protein] reductase
VKLDGQLAVVTGAGRGIGKAIALQLAEEGADIVLVSRTDSDLKKVAKEIEGMGRRTLIQSCDVGSEKEVQKMAGEVLEEFNKIDILVNNAGVGYFTPVVEMSLEDWDMMMATNLRGMFLCSKTFLPSMIERKTGQIVNIASLAGKNFFPNGAGYCATKFGVIGFSKSLMLEVRKQGVRVFTVCPGSVDTSFSSSKNPERRARILRAEDVAEIILSVLTMPKGAHVSEVEIRPSNPP